MVKQFSLWVVKEKRLGLQHWRRPRASALGLVKGSMTSCVCVCQLQAEYVFNEASLALVAQEVVKVVHYCHGAGMLHGDVKPAKYVCMFCHSITEFRCCSLVITCMLVDFSTLLQSHAAH
jgi:hypothetical protein